MSRLSDYSKFDHLVDSDDDEVDDEVQKKSVNHGQGSNENRALHQGEPATKTAASPPPAAVAQGPRTRRDEETGRYVFEYGGRKVYEWEQTLDDMTIYVEAPSLSLSASALVCEIRPSRLRLGLRGHDRFFLDEPTGSKVDTTESSWYLDDGIIHIVLVKAHRGETWDCPLRGRLEDPVDPMTKQQIQKDLLLERFQEENPGMDFRGASFNGEVPDPRSFMGGVKYK